MSGAEKKLETILVFFGKALDALRPPFMKLLVVFAVTLLVTIGLFAKEADPNLKLVLVVVVVIFFASLAAGLQYAEHRLRRMEKTEEELKKALRKEVFERQSKDIQMTR